MYNLNLTKLWGIINITPEPFSGNKNSAIQDQIIKHAISLISQGANVINLRIQSGKNNINTLSWQEEWSYLKYLLPTIHKESISKNIQICLDSDKFQIIEKAISYINILNDISGLKDPKILSIIRESKIPTVLLHNIELSTNKNNILNQNISAIDITIKCFKNKLTLLNKLEFDKNQFILDPGIGLINNMALCLNILQNINKLHKFNLPILIGHSRENFLNHFGTKSIQELDFNTAIISMYLAHNKISNIKVHNVAMNKNMIAIAKLSNELKQGNTLEQYLEKFLQHSNIYDKKISL